MTSSPWANWREHFEWSVAQPLPDAMGESGERPEIAAALVASLQRFQKGEAGEGRIAREIDGFTHAAVDDDYRRALKAFVKEEGRHGRILATLLNALGRSTIDDTWTDALFVRGRRLLGVRLKLLVLLAAEVVGIGFYGLLAERLDDGFVKRALTRICDEERHHLAFHRDFFARVAGRGVARIVFLVAWALVGTAAALVVALAHRRTLRALSIPWSLTLARLAGLLVDAGRAHWTTSLLR